MTSFSRPIMCKWVSATDISLFTGSTNMPQIPTVFNR